MRAPYSRTLVDLLSEQSRYHPERAAVISGTTELTYLDLLRRAGLVSGALQSRSVGRGDRVGLLCSNRAEWLEVCFGASAAGAVVVPFSTWSTRHELEFLLQDSGVRYLFAMPSFGDRDYAADLEALLYDREDGGPLVPSLERVVILGQAPSSFETYADFLADAEESADSPPGLCASAADDALILYTSGTSAKPKAIRLKHFGIIENGFNIGERQGLRPGDRVHLSAPLFWSFGSANALPAAFSHGAALVLQEKFEAGGAIELVERHRCTAIYTLPSMTRAMLDHPAFHRDRVASLRTGVTIGSQPEFVDTVERLGVSEVCNIYGATETYGNCCVTWHHWPVARRAACQGPPLPGNELRFVDLDTGEQLAPGQPGLVEIRGYIMAGYWGTSAQLATEAFTSDGFYRTGDVGYLNQDGDFVFVGRNTELIKRAGINVSPAEIEEILLQHPGVAQVGVIGVADRKRGEIVVAFAVPVAGAKVSGEDLLGHCRSLTSKYKVPDRIEFCDALPLTPTGKLMRRALKDMAASLRD